MAPWHQKAQWKCQTWINWSMMCFFFSFKIINKGLVWFYLCQAKNNASKKKSSPTVFGENDACQEMTTGLLPSWGTGSLRVQRGGLMPGEGAQRGPQSSLRLLTSLQWWAYWSSFYNCLNCPCITCPYSMHSIVHNKKLKIKMILQITAGAHFGILCILVFTSLSCICVATSICHFKFPGW